MIWNLWHVASCIVTARLSIFFFFSGRVFVKFATCGLIVWGESGFAD